LLVGEASDDVKVQNVLRSCSASSAAEQAAEACRELEQSLGGRPNMLILHATPGFEESILAGIRAAFGNSIPVYGGSAADNTLEGNWLVFADGKSTKEGFLLIGLDGGRPPRAGFLGGYLPTEHSGTVTRADGRTILEIDGEPAARVYSRWSGGVIAEELERGGSVLSKTNLHPLARTVSSAHGMPRRLLAHPHAVDPASGALSFFAQFRQGEQVTLMTSTKDPLVKRVRRTVQRARGAGPQPRGALLIYCAGCLGMLLDRASEISREFQQELGDLPFVGLATYGEQGTFFERSDSLHGNLMCSAVLF
jgi:hypothetical protein